MQDWFGYLRKIVDMAYINNLTSFPQNTKNFFPVKRFARVGLSARGNITVAGNPVYR
jgi:hypothetical protein